MPKNVDFPPDNADDPEEQVLNELSKELLADQKSREEALLAKKQETPDSETAEVLDPENEEDQKKILHEMFADIEKKDSEIEKLKKELVEGDLDDEKKKKKIEKKLNKLVSDKNALYEDYILLYQEVTGKNYNEELAKSAGLPVEEAVLPKSQLPGELNTESDQQAKTVSGDKPDNFDFEIKPEKEVKEKIEINITPDQILNKLGLGQKESVSFEDILDAVANYYKGNKNGSKEVMDAFFDSADYKDKERTIERTPEEYQVFIEDFFGLNKTEEMVDEKKLNVENARQELVEAQQEFKVKREALVENINKLSVQEREAFEENNFSDLEKIEQLGASVMRLFKQKKYGQATILIKNGEKIIDKLIADIKKLNSLESDSEEKLEKEFQELQNQYNILSKILLETFPLKSGELKSYKESHKRELEESTRIEDKIKKMGWFIQELHGASPRWQKEAQNEAVENAATDDISKSGDEEKEAVLTPEQNKALVVLTLSNESLKKEIEENPELFLLKNEKAVEILHSKEVGSSYEKLTKKELGDDAKAEARKYFENRKDRLFGGKEGEKKLIEKVQEIYRNISTTKAKTKKDRTEEDFKNLKLYNYIEKAWDNLSLDQQEAYIGKEVIGVLTGRYKFAAEPSRKLVSLKQKIKIC